MGCCIFPRMRSVIPESRSGSAWTIPGAAFLRGAANVMLELRKVCKTFNRIEAVDDVSFSARAGEITGYLGPNGSGKSTTMKMLDGLLRLTSGAILFNGQPVAADLIGHKEHMGYVPEEPH